MGVSYSEQVKCRELTSFFPVEKVQVRDFSHMKKLSFSEACVFCGSTELCNLDDNRQWVCEGCWNSRAVTIHKEGMV